MQAAARRPRTNHLDLAQRILDVARQRGFEPAPGWPSSRSPRSAMSRARPCGRRLRLLTERGVLSWEAGHRLSACHRSRRRRLPSPPNCRAPRKTTWPRRSCATASARRLDEAVTVGGLVRRYDADRKTVLKALRKLSEDNLVERAPGQSWLFRPVPDGPDALAESYEFRLLLEPAALLTPGFRLDGARAAAVAAGDGSAAGARPMPPSTSGSSSASTPSSTA